MQNLVDVNPYPGDVHEILVLKENKLVPAGVRDGDKDKQSEKVNGKK